MSCLGPGGAGKTWWGQDHSSPQTQSWNMKINNKIKHPEADEEGVDKVRWVVHPFAPPRRAASVWDQLSP